MSIYFCDGTLGLVVKFLPAEWCERLPSTNAAVLERFGRGAAAEGYVLAAREQTAGRGRFERQWVTQAGRDLTFSCLIRCSDSGHLTSLPMAAALAVADLLEQIGLEPRTKWPNDVLVKGRKICGILAELPPQGETGENFQLDGKTQARARAVVLGIGLNVNMGAETAASIERPATSILLETGAERPVESVLQPLLGQLEYWCSRWRQGGFGSLKSAWCSRCEGLGGEVRIGDGGSMICGQMEGFGNRGQLRLRLPDGSRTEIWSGDLDAPDQLR